MLGTVKIGPLRIPISRIRLVGGGLELHGETRASWFKPIRPFSAYPEVYGEDGQPTRVSRMELVTIPQIDRGAVLTLVLRVKLDEGGDWITIQRMSREIAAPRKAITQ
jgi:hypothetical protein